MVAAYLTLVFAADAPQTALEARFESAVRPIFVEQCQKCHGPTKQNGGLRFDRRESLLKGGDSGPAIVPGKPDESLLIKAVRRHPDVSAMPPMKPLPPASVKALEEWVKNGAVWPEPKQGGPALGDPAALAAAAKKHWAFQPVQRTKPPEVRRPEWASTSLDRFMLTKLESAGIEPSNDADRATLLRRVSFDLIGLPPTPAEVDAFLTDPDPTPLAFAKVVDRLLASPHYGERWGRHWLDVARYADTKGYVFQEERKYPFAYTYRDWVMKALNGDIGYDQFVREQLSADKYPSPDNHHLAAMGFLTVGRRFLQDIQEITDDRIDVVSRGFLGLTVSCARCHDHKFDPISMADYYGLYGVFASSEEPKDLPVLADAEGAAQRADFQRKLKERSDAVSKYLNEQHAVIEKRLVDDAEKLLALSLQVNEKAGPRALADAARQQGLSVGAVRKWNERWTKAVAEGRSKNDALFTLWSELAGIADGQFAAKAPGVVAKVKAAQTKVNPAVTALFGSSWDAKSNLPKSFGNLVREAARSPTAAQDFPALFGASGVFRVPMDQVQDYVDRRQRERLKGLEREVEQLKANHPGAEARAMVMVDRAKPVEPRIFLRGNPGRQGPQVPRTIPRVLSGGEAKPFRDGSGRRELAEAITNPNNPLTARVFVNRIWQWRFGKGLAPSPSDFGLRSEPPTHPELLDHLAARFVDDGWSVKRLHRWMLASRAYQLSGTATPTALEKDPDNKLLARFPRLRLDWESLRDAVLATTGGLDGAVGGRPAPLFADGGTRRRTVYGFVDRQNLDGEYRTFDFATPDATSPQRFVTIVPQQGLFLLNSKFLLTEADRLAARPEVASLADPRRRVEMIYRLAYSRMPESQETDQAVRFLSAQPEWTSDPRAAWARLAQALMMANEFAFVD